MRDADAAAARQLLTKSGAVPGQIIIGLNPGAAYGWAKRWLTDRYARVADELAEKRGAKILIFGAADERTWPGRSPARCGTRRSYARA